MLVEVVLAIFGWIAEIACEFLIDTVFGWIVQIVLWPFRKLLDCVAPWTGG